MRREIELLGTFRVADETKERQENLLCLRFVVQPTSVTCVSQLIDH